MKRVRGKQILSWGVLGIFIAGFFWAPVGVWTGPVLGAWFIGTQRLRRGFVWMMLLTFVPMAIGNWRKAPLRAPLVGLETLGWMLVASLAIVAPFVFYRATRAHLAGLLKTGLLETLALPVAGAAVKMASLTWLPNQAVGFAYHGERLTPLLTELNREFGSVAVTFVVLWFAAIVVWMWNREFRGVRFAMGIAGFALIYFGATWYGAIRARSGILGSGAGLGWVCAGGVALLGAWALMDGMRHRRSWADRRETIALLRSPTSGDALQLEEGRGGEALASASGERFPIRAGVPDFRTAEDLSGANGKYNHLYETIGGFYDDFQRVALALSGVNRDAYVMSYLRRLEVKPGDKVLETSVGTGLNFKYLPRGIRRYGLDLAWDMLVNCQENFRRWGVEGELFLGNAERLPFADESIDVVFHTGGINFFSDRGKAIGEMIRVARPGSLILIVDETEKHVKGTYEKIPYTREFYKGRDETVVAPVALVPAEMEEVRTESIFNGRLYALTFRKPRAVDGAGGALGEHAAGV
ncbi:MAG: class I SAM-dependent methyltransferase [Acidobacteriaceae bacterium]